MLYCYLCFQRPMMNHSINGRGKLLPKGMRMHMISWIDAPDDVYFMATNATKWVIPLPLLYCFVYNRHDARRDRWDIRITNHHLAVYLCGFLWLRNGLYLLYETELTILTTPISSIKSKPFDKFSMLHSQRLHHAQCMPTRSIRMFF